MVDLTQLCMDRLYGQWIRKDVEEENYTRSENWLPKDSDERVIEYDPLLTSEHVIKYTSDRAIGEMKEIEKRMPSHLGVFVLSHSRRSMNIFVH